jgi:hypothetical protein
MLSCSVCKVQNWAVRDLGGGTAVCGRASCLLAVAHATPELRQAWARSLETLPKAA